MLNGPQFEGSRAPRLKLPTWEHPSMLTWPKRAERVASVYPVENLHTVEESAPVDVDVHAQVPPLRLLTFNIQTA